MKRPWLQQSAAPPPAELRAHCPHCRCELPVMEEEAMLLVSRKPVWLFCPVCVRLVAPQPDRNGSKS
jgi:hypothetical protein